MNPYSTYSEQALVGWTRIDMLLALYDAAIERLENAVAALQRDDKDGAKSFLGRALLVVGGLVSGLSPEAGNEQLADNMGRMYEFVLHAIQSGERDKVESALGVLRTLREGFLGIRDEAIQLERQGVIPPVEQTQAIAVTA